MKAYVVFDCVEPGIGTANILAVFTDFQKARECAIRAVDAGISDVGTIFVDSYNTETGEADSAWNYKELIMMEVK